MNDNRDMDRTGAEDDEQTTTRLVRRIFEKVSRLALGALLPALFVFVWNFGSHLWAYIEQLDNKQDAFAIELELVKDRTNSLEYGCREIDGKTPREQISAILRECKHVQSEGHELKREMREVRAELSSIWKQIQLQGAQIERQREHFHDYKQRHP